MVPIDAEALEDWILANAPEFVEGMRKAEEEFRRGETIGMDEVFARLDARDRRQAAARTRMKKAAKTRR